jgi:hypothetical protein
MNLIGVPETTYYSSYTKRLEVALFSRIFTGYGTRRYMGCDNTEVKDLSSDPDWHLAMLR